MENSISEESVDAVNGLMETEKDDDFPGDTETVPDSSLTHWEDGESEPKLVASKQDSDHLTQLEVSNALGISDTDKAVLNGRHQTCDESATGDRVAETPVAQHALCDPTALTEDRGKGCCVSESSSKSQGSTPQGEAHQIVQPTCNGRDSFLHKSKCCGANWLWKTYSCRHCNQYFMNLQHLQIHRRVHHGWKVFECLKCLKSFVTMFSLKKHQLFHCGGNKKKVARLRNNLMGVKRGFRCHNCGKKLPNHRFYRMHIRSCLESDSHICSYCGKGFSTCQRAKRHEEFHRGLTLVKDRRNTRQNDLKKICSDQTPKANTSSVTKGLSNYKQRRVIPHKGNSHASTGHASSSIEGLTGGKPMQCRLCPLSFSDLKQLVWHQKVHVASNVTLFQCTYCGKVFSRVNTLKAHMVCHTGERPYSCDLCGKPFAYKSFMNHHRAKCVSAEKRQTSEYPSKSRTHIKQEPDEKPFACDFCDKKFLYEEHLKYHESYHFGLLPKNPDFNSSGTSSLPNDESATTFSGENPLSSQIEAQNKAKKKISGVVQCTTCGKYFSSMYRLKAHSVVHTGEKPYQCQFCGKSFSFPSTKKRHEKKMHTQRQGCGMRSNNTASLTKTNRGVSVGTGQNEEGPQSGGTKVEQNQGGVIQHKSREANPSFKKDTKAADTISRSLSEQGIDRKGTSETLETCTTDQCYKISSQIIRYWSKELQTKVSSVDKESDTNKTESQVKKKHICGVCGAQFQWANKFADHLAHSHTDRKSRAFFSCSVCNKSFKQKHFLLAHIIFHNRRILTCHFCKITFQQTSSLKEHLLRQHAKQVQHLSKLPLETLKCLCGEEFLRRKDLLLHEKLHKNENFFVCKFCNKVFLHSTPYKRHLLLHSKKTDSHQCVQCVSDTKQPVARRNKHKTLKPYLCQYCNKQFLSKGNLHLHMTLYHNKKKRQRSPKLCVKCGVFCTSKKDCRCHLKRHKREPQPAHKSSKTDISTNITTTGTTDKGRISEKRIPSSPVKKNVLSLLPVSPVNKLNMKKMQEKRLKIKVSPMKTKSKGMLSLWSSKEVSEKHSCVVCLETFQSTWALQNHMTVHLRLKPARCDFCDKIFAHVADLIEHKLQHCEMSPGRSTEPLKKSPRPRPKLFLCGLCDSQFSARSHLAAHMVVHTGAKPFSCDVCGRKFSFLSCLKRHLIVHIKGEKLAKARSRTSLSSTRKWKAPNGLEFHCADCGRKFSRLDGLHDHICHHLGSLPYKCPNCEAQFANFADLKQHKKLAHRVARTFKKHICEVCGKIFQRPKQLKTHMDIHSDIKSWVCEVCGSEFPSLRRLKKHQMLKCEAKSEDGEEPKRRKSVPHDSGGGNDLELFTGVPCKLNLHNFQCVDCHKVFSRYRHLVKHRQSCMRETTFSCATCGEKFSEIKALEKHIDDFHNISNKMNAHIITSKKRQRRSRGYNPTGKKHYRCDVCGKEFVSALCLSNHSALHTGNMAVICECCGASFTHMNALQKHQTQTSCGASGGHFTCKFCDKKFECLRDLRLHNSTKLGPRFTCTKCNSKFTSCYRVQKHQALCNLGKAVIPNICEVCGKRFSNTSNMKEHMITHTGEKPFACGQCCRRFGHMAALRRHFSVHGGDLPFKCKVCDKGFTIASALKKHEDSHLDLKSRQVFKCEECGKGFVTRQRLKRHAYLHKEEKPLKCEFCGKGFINPFHMKNHLVQHHGMPPEEHRCKFCGLIFTSRFQLTQHQDLNCTQLADTISQLLPPDGESDSALLRNLRDDESIVISPLPVIEEEYLATQTTEIIIQENDGNGNITEKTIVVTLPENIDLAQWLQNGGEIQTETMDGEAISYITMAESPEQLPPLQGDSLTAVQEVMKDMKSGEEIVCQYCGEAFDSQEEAQVHLQHQHPFVEFAELPAPIPETSSSGPLQGGSLMEQEHVNDGTQGNSCTGQEHATDETRADGVMAQEAPSVETQGNRCMELEQISDEVQEDGLNEQEHTSDETHIDYKCILNVNCMAHEHANDDNQENGLVKQEPISSESPESPPEALEEEKNHMCQHCGKQFSRGHDLNRHILTCSKPLLAEDRSTVHGVEDNQKVTQSPKTSKRKFVCDECGAQYVNFVDLRCHKLNVHSGDKKPEASESCELNQLGQWDGTMQQRQPKKKVHACLLCDKVFVRKRSLQQHVLTHGEGKAFKCDICDKHYAYESSLWSHMKTHEEGGKERHTCFVCGKSYMDKCYLKKHMLTHTSGTMPYICNLCSKGFLLPAGLKRHRRDVHKLAF